MKTRTDVVLILWNSDVIDLLSWVLRDRNLTSCGIEPREGVDKMEDLIVSCSPSVVVFDLEPPYDRSAAVAMHLMDRFAHVAFVMTCADSAYAVKRVPWLSGHPLFQKPYEMDAIVNVVQSMTNTAPKNAVALSVGAC